MNIFLERFIQINQKTSWDLKRGKVQNRLYEYFDNVSTENKTYLRKYIDSKGVVDTKLINSFEEEIKSKLYSIRKVYSTGTPSAEGSSMSMISESKFGLLFALSDLQVYSQHNALTAEEFFVYLDFSNKKIDYREFNYREKQPLRFNLKAEVIIREQLFNDDLPRYLNVYITTTQHTFVGSYFVDIKKLDLVRPYKLEVESNDDVFKTILEVSLFKWSAAKVKDEDSDFYNFVFREPFYMYNNNLENEINDYDKNNNELDVLSKQFSKMKEDTIRTVKAQYDSKFIIEELSKNTLGNHTSITLPQNPNEPDPTVNRLEDLLQTIYSDHPAAQILLSWAKANTSSFEEILFASILVDPNAVTIYDKLKLLFDVSKMQNFLIHNQDSITLKKLKELVYSLYKRYMIYFTKSDVERMVEYLVKREKLNNYKWSIMYPKDKEALVNRAINGTDHISNKNLLV